MRIPTWVLVASVVATGGVLVYNVVSAPRPNTDDAPVAEIISSAANSYGAPRHPVTEDMKKRAAAMDGQKLADMTLPDDTGKPVQVAEILKAKPTLFLGIKDGCPCNLESQHFFNDLYDHYGSKIGFYGVMDADEKVAKLFKESLLMEFPVLCSPKETKIFEALGTEQSVYTTLVNQDGVIIRQWPGYSKQILSEINDELAKLSGLERVSMDLTMAPEEPTSGCFYGMPIGWDPNK